MAVFSLLLLFVIISFLCFVLVVVVLCGCFASTHDAVGWCHTGSPSEIALVVNFSGWIQDYDIDVILMGCWDSRMRDVRNSIELNGNANAKGPCK